MRLDIEAARMLGADGVVIGALTRDARVDEEQVRTLIDGARELPVTFHRAFDFTRDRDEALETLMRLGIRRVLTSGGAPSALEGVEAIRSLARRGAGRITVMAGGSVREETIQEIVHRSGVSEAHVRGTREAMAAMSPFPVAMRLRKKLPENEQGWEETDEARIREFVRLANG